MMLKFPLLSSSASSKRSPSKKGLKNMESTLFLASSTFPDSQVSQWVSRHESTLCSVGLQLPGEQDQGRLKVFLDRVQCVNVVKDM